jgi:hypothetical protein
MKENPKKETSFACHQNNIRFCYLCGLCDLASIDESGLKSIFIAKLFGVLGSVITMYSICRLRVTLRITHPGFLNPH